MSAERATLAAQPIEEDRMSAVLEELEAGAGAPEDVVAQPESTVMFMSRRSALRLTWKSRYNKRGPHGEPDGVTQGMALGFVDNVLRIPKMGDVVRITDTINAGTFECSADEALSFLRKHPLNGDVHEGFWEVDPVAPAPSEQEIQALLDAATTLDTEALLAIVAAEESGFQRESFLRIARGTLAKISKIEEAAQKRAEELAAAKVGLDPVGAPAAAQEPQEAPQPADPEAVDALSTDAPPAQED